MPQIKDRTADEDIAGAPQVTDGADAVFALPDWLNLDPAPPGFDVHASGGNGPASANLDLISGAIGEAPRVDFEPLYENDFQPGSDSHWVYYDHSGATQIPVPLQSDEEGNQYLVSTGPWWLDPNHTSPGAGYLNLLAIGYAQPDGADMSLDSLVGTQVSFDIRTEDLTLPEGAHIRFWFQAIDPKIPGSSQTVNYALDVAIDELVVEGQWTRVTLTLSEDDEDWIALFSNPDRTDTYNRSATIRDALEGQLIDSGFIILIGNELPDSPATGAVMLDNITYARAAAPEVRYTGEGAFQHLGLDARYSDVDSDTIGLRIDLTVTQPDGESGVVDIVFAPGSNLVAESDGILLEGVRIADLTRSPDGYTLSLTFTEAVSEATVNEVLAGLGYTSQSSGYGRDFLELTLTDSEGAASTTTVNLWRPYVPPENEDFVIHGSSGQDWLHGADGSDTLYGYEGDDLLNGHGGVDVMVGGDGDDVYYVDHPDDVVIEEADGGNEDRVFASVSYSLAPGSAVEILGTSFNAGVTPIDLAGNEFANRVQGNEGANVLHGKGGDDVVVGAGGDDSLYGGSGQDTLNGGDGDDLLDGGADADIMTGGAGNDLYFVDDALDRIEEFAGEGTDRVFSSVSYQLAAGVAVESLSTNNHAGVAAINLSGNEFDNRVQGNEGANVLDGGGGNDIVVGGGGDDNLSGGAGSDILHGGAGQDVLDGGAGADVMVGGDGDDWYIVDHSGDAVVEGPAGGTADRVFASVDYTLGAGVAVEILGTTNNEGTAAINLSGNAFANHILGNIGSNTLRGEAGDDILVGGGGDDILIGGTGRDSLNGGDGSDMLYGGTPESADSEGNVFMGGAGDDHIWGGSAADLYRFRRGDGRDLVHEVGGKDVLEILGSVSVNDLVFEIVGKDLYIGLADPAAPGSPASEVEDFIRIVGGGEVFVGGDGSRSWNTIDHILIGGQMIDVAALDLPWATSAAASGPVLMEAAGADDLDALAMLSPATVPVEFPSTAAVSQQRADSELWLAPDTDWFF